MPLYRLFLCIFLSAVALHAQTKPPMDFHNDGIAALRKGDYPAARTAFQESLKLKPGNPTSLYNLGLVEYRAGNEGLALGLWRKALVLAPGFFAPSHAIHWAEAKLPRVASGNEFSLWEQFRETFLITIPLQSYLFLVVLLLLLSGWLFLRYIGTRRRAVLDESPLPPFPWVASVFVLIWVLAIAATGAKLFDMSVTRATIVSEKVPVRTSPDNDGTALFDLIEGHEVIVRESVVGDSVGGVSTGDWFQVSVPGGGMTGWVPKESVFVSSK